MSDPLSDVIALLRPRAVFSKGISGAGRWAVRYSEFGQPSFCAVLEGSCRLAVDGQSALTLQAGDFVLLPTTPGFTLSGFEAVNPKRIDPKGSPAPTGEVRHGTRGGKPDVRLLGGYFDFDSPDAGLLVSLLPALVHVRGVPRLSTLASSVSPARSDWRPWNICSRGAWPWQRICSAVTRRESPRLPSASATARRALSAPLSAVMWASLRPATRGRVEKPVKLPVEGARPCLCCDVFP
jgi:hypothetical protein